MENINVIWIEFLFKNLNKQKTELKDLVSNMENKFRMNFETFSPD